MRPSHPSETLRFWPLFRKRVRRGISAVIRHRALLLTGWLAVTLGDYISGEMGGLRDFLLTLVLSLPAIMAVAFGAILLLAAAETLGLDSTRRRRARERWLGARQARRAAPSA